MWSTRLLFSVLTVVEEFFDSLISVCISMNMGSACLFLAVCLGFVLAGFF